MAKKGSLLSGLREIVRAKQAVAERGANGAFGDTKCLPLVFFSLVPISYKQGWGMKGRTIKWQEM